MLKAGSAKGVYLPLKKRVLASFRFSIRLRGGADSGGISEGSECGAMGKVFSSVSDETSV